ncbi:hypothetical protein VNO77_22965 [Canavalia gladiata]|uniref:Uncharacterized protein n=1 Tax=Canavalia gladiata TaxID=3824 RepID=A0AAN9L707_CANGL
MVRKEERGKVLTFAAGPGEVDLNSGSGLASTSWLFDPDSMASCWLAKHPAPMLAWLECGSLPTIGHHAELRWLVVTPYHSVDQGVGASTAASS